MASYYIWYLNNINRFQNFVAKKIQGFSTRTCSYTAESMLGLNKRKLMFMYELFNMPDKSIRKEIFIRKYIMYVLNRGSVSMGYVLNRGSVSMGFITDMCHPFAKYNLYFILNHFFTNNGRLHTKSTCKNTVNSVFH